MIIETAQLLGTRNASYQQRSYFICLAVVMHVISLRSIVAKELALDSFEVASAAGLTLHEHPA